MERVSENVGYEDGKTAGQGYDQPGHAGAAYQAYCNRVCSVLKKATKKEKISLSEELLDHMESHAEALVELGWDLQEARDYAVEAMGDPETVGRQYDEKLSSFWLWCGRVLRAILVLDLFVMLMISVGVLFWQTHKNLQARWFPQREIISRQQPEDQLIYRQELDLIIPVEDQRVRAYRLELYGDETEGEYWVDVYTVRYAQNPLQYTSLDGVRLEGEMAGTGRGSAGAMYWISREWIEWGQESVTLIVYRVGEDAKVTIPIQWEVTP